MFKIIPKVPRNVSNPQSYRSPDQEQEYESRSQDEGLKFQVMQSKPWLEVEAYHAR